MMTTAFQCQAQVRQSMAFYRTRRCSNNAVPGTNFCHIHDPEKIKARQQAKLALEEARRLARAAAHAMPSTDEVSRIAVRFKALEKQVEQQATRIRELEELLESARDALGDGR